MSVFELLVLVVATPGAVLALRDVRARRSALDDSACRRDEGELAYRRGVPARTTELAISVRFRSARAREERDRTCDRARSSVELDPVEPAASAERDRAGAS